MRAERQSVESVSPVSSCEADSTESLQMASSPTPTANVADEATSRKGWASLATLVFQNSALTLTMRASRVRAAGPQLYLATSAVVVCEILKLLASVGMLVTSQGVSGATASIRAHILSAPLLENLKLLVPAALYTLQNNLQYVAASHLDPAIFQVLYQLKLVTTALLTVMMLDRRISAVRWVAVLLLTAGCAMVQVSNLSVTTARNDSNQLLGCAAVVLACCTSAFAGVYLEKIVKQTKPSVWVRNIQMASFGLVIGAAGMFYKDREVLVMHGMLVGFDWMVWVVVALQSFGGLLTAVVVKYADNVKKGFATGLAIIVSCLASVYLFGFVITVPYAVGAFLVFTSVVLYSIDPQLDTCLRCYRTIPSIHVVEMDVENPTPKPRGRATMS
eukprot:Sspe_Gene.71921::Locus_42755_Transcript_1_1_Confidence_1.000_Length_1250::g.71921::m.71921/K15272/SLC35A1_2_3; solute carrier family 35 (UDP-sugar transporter), member A1/2/3